MPQVEVKPGDVVFTEDGRRAIYAGEIDGQKFVRIVLSREDEEYGVEEWPADKLTPVSRVLTTAPVESYAPAIEKTKVVLAALREEAAAVRASVLDLQKQEREFANAASKYPALQTALDFIEGRITHVAIVPEYSTPSVMTLKDALSDKWDGRLEGLRLLSLFGTDASGKVQWNINRYRDGSGSTWNWIYPFTSKAAAEQFIRDEFSKAIEAWRASGDARAIARFEKCNVELDRPRDWLDHVASLKAARKAEKLTKLRAEISEIEAEQVSA
jgi:hypothetical protein